MRLIDALLVVSVTSRPSRSEAAVARNQTTCLASSKCREQSLATFALAAAWGCPVAASKPRRSPPERHPDAIGRIDVELDGDARRHRTACRSAAAFMLPPEQSRAVGEPDGAGRVRVRLSIGPNERCDKAARARRPSFIFKALDQAHHNVRVDRMKLRTQSSAGCLGSRCHCRCPRRGANRRCLFRPRPSLTESSAVKR